jgi:ligand-binding sensor domain-containing protein
MVESAGRGAITEILELDGVLLALGEAGAFLVSRDRGTTWKRRVVDARLRSATMDGTGALWLGGSQGALFRWPDGQSEPEAVKSGTTDAILALAADGAGHVLLATDQRAVLRRPIGGASWSRVLEPREPTTEAAFERRTNGNAVVWFGNPDERYELVPVER